MLNNLSFSTLTTTVSNLWNTAKSYVTTPQLDANQNLKRYRRIDYKRLLILGTLSLFSTTRNQAGLSLGLAVLFADSVNAAYPTVANPIPLQYVQAGQSFSFDIDLGQVFNDADGDVMVYSGLRMTDGSAFPSWLGAELILLGSYNTAVAAHDVAVQNNVAYVVAYDLLAINVTNPKNLVLLDSHRPPTSARAAAVQGQTAYVLHWNAGYAASLQILDVNNPKNLVLLSTYVLGGSNILTGIAVRNTLAYIMDNTILRIVDISNPMAPVSVSNYSYNLLSSRGIALLGNVAYIAHSNILGLVDVSNANAPSYLDNLYLPTFANGVAVQNNTAYVACDLSGLQLVDTTDKRNAALLGNYDVGGATAYGVVVQGHLAYLASGGLQIINVTDAQSPSLLYRYYLSGYSWAVDVQKDVAYIANDAGLRTISLNQVRISGSVPIALSGSYNFTIYATNAKNEQVATVFGLQINPAPIPAPVPGPMPFPAPVPMPSPVPVPMSMVPSPMVAPIISTTFVPTVAPTNSSIVIPQNNRTGFIVPSSAQNSSDSTISSTTMSSIQSSTQQSSNSVSFNVVATSNAIYISFGVSTTLTTEHLSITGNARPDQVIYTVQGNNPNIVITVNGIETNQFNQADVEGNFVEVALQGVNCGDYSTDLQLEASVAGGNASPQRVDVGLIFEGTTCANAGRLSAFSFRDVNIGFWAQKRETKPEEQPTYVPTLQH